MPWSECFRTFAVHQSRDRKEPLRIIPEEVNVDIYTLKPCKIITTFPQEDVEADTKTEAPTNSLEVVEEGTKAEAAIKDGSSKANNTTADNDSSEGSDDRADINTTTIFNVNNIDPERVVLTEYMTPETETLSKVISPGKESKKATEKATKASKWEKILLRLRRYQVIKQMIKQ